jgi:alanine dehydrogenase
VLQIGVPTEIKLAERRIALVPEDCKVLINQGCSIHIQAGAGVESGYDDALYIKAGCSIQATAADLYKNSKLIVKVKEPLEGDLKWLTKEHVLFCYLHLASGPELTKSLLEKQIKSVAFETVVVDGKTPLLAPMSAIAGRLATQIGTWFLHSPHGGRGTLMGGIKGLSKGKVTIVGAGVAGTEAGRLAYGMGAEVTFLDINADRLAALKVEMPRLITKTSNDETVLACAKESDLLVGAVYVIGRKAPIVITEDHIKAMPKRSVVVDISIDQGGCIATSKTCTHEEPTYIKYDVIHSAITNLPAAAPRTASEVLSHAIRPYVKELASNNWSAELIGGINTEAGLLKIVL